MSLTAASASSILDLARAAGAADGVAPLDEATVLALTHHPERTRAVSHPDGFALLSGADLADLAVVVAPSARGQGRGTELAAAALALREASEARGPVTAWMHGDRRSARALAARLGFTARRELWVMRRDGSLPLPATPRPPDGLSVRSYTPGDESELLRINAAAFAWHPEQGAMDAANLAERMAQPWFDPAGLIEVWEGAGDATRMLGFHWTKQHSPTLGEIYVVGVDPEAQGRGLGRLLTLAGLEHMRDLGEVHLYVESDNDPAVRLYESLGFTHAAADTHVQFTRA